jgi:mitogen-activated protein kinase kinase kinase 19
MLMSSGVIKLIDFGCAKRLKMNQNSNSIKNVFKSLKGTPFWMAPEGT